MQLNMSCQFEANRIGNEYYLIHLTRTSSRGAHATFDKMLEDHREKINTTQNVEEYEFTCAGL